MNENEARSLQEWYGLIPAEEPPAAARPDRKRRTRRIAGVLFLALAALGAAALLIFGGSLLHREPREPQSMEEFFDGYYDTAENAAWSADMPTAQYGLGVEVPAVPVGDEMLTLGELYEKMRQERRRDNDRDRRLGRSLGQRYHLHGGRLHPHEHARARRGEERRRHALGRQGVRGSARRRGQRDGHSRAQD